MNGGAAFARPTSVHCYEYTATDGMSPRDWFAGMAMQGMLAYGVATVYRERAAEEGIPFSRLLAEESYRHADAMLAEREKGQSDG